MKLNNKQRMNHLEDCISKIFKDYSPDRLAKSYSKSTMLMIEIIEIGPRSTMVMDWERDVEFGPVKFPDELLPLLRRKDTFLVTMGFKNNQWEPLYMSSPYHSN